MKQALNSLNLSWTPVSTPKPSQPHTFTLNAHDQQMLLNSPTITTNHFLLYIATRCQVQCDLIVILLNGAPLIWTHEQCNQCNNRFKVVAKEGIKSITVWNHWDLYNALKTNTFRKEQFQCNILQMLIKPHTLREAAINGGYSKKSTRSLHDFIERGLADPKWNEQFEFIDYTTVKACLSNYDKIKFGIALSDTCICDYDNEFAQRNRIITVINQYHLLRMKKTENWNYHTHNMYRLCIILEMHHYIVCARMCFLFFVVFLFLCFCVFAFLLEFVFCWCFFFGMNTKYIETFK